MYIDVDKRVTIITEMKSGCRIVMLHHEITKVNV